MRTDDFEGCFAQQLNIASIGQSIYHPTLRRSNAAVDDNSGEDLVLDNIVNHAGFVAGPEVVSLYEFRFQISLNQMGAAVKPA